MDSASRTDARGATTKPPDPHVVVLFGATGDLARRKLLPGLLHLDQADLLPDSCRIVGTSLEDLSDEEFVTLAHDAHTKFSNHPVTDDEWTVIRHHPGWGAEIVGLRPELASVARAVREHHERFDGAGYPMGRHGEEICIQARVVAVCDAWAAMRSHRPYRDALPVETAEAELRAGAAGQFDPRVVDAFLAVVADAGAVAA